MVKPGSLKLALLASLTLLSFSLSEALNIGVQFTNTTISIKKECSRKCESDFCSVPPFLRYGKYCGLLYSGCPGEKPCDGLDSCCQTHDACVQAEHNNYLSQRCNQAFLDCISAFRATGKHTFNGNKCNVEEVVDIISAVIKAALLAGRFLHRP